MHPLFAARRLDVLHSHLESQRSVLLSWLDIVDDQLHHLRQTIGSEDYSRILSVINRMRDEAAVLGAGGQISLQALQELCKQLCRITVALPNINPIQEENALLSVS
jgi:hypothetical protein